MSNNSNRIRIKDVAEKAGVSIGTVDRVLHNRGEVSASTKDKVLKIVEEMGYTPNLFAKTLSSKRSCNIAVIIPEASDNNPYWRKPLKGILQGAEEIKDFNGAVNVFTFHPTNSRSFNEQCELALADSPDGIIFNPLFKEASLEFIKSLEEKEIPYIYIDIDLEQGNNLAYFGQNAMQSGRVAAKLLSQTLELNSKILILKLANQKLISRHIRRREDGFIDFLANNNLCKCKLHSVDIDLLESGEPYISLNKLFEVPGKIQSVFVPNSRVFMVADYLKTKKADIKLIGFDLIEQNVKHLKSGIIDFLIIQKPEQQGYSSVTSMFNYLVLKKPIERINYSPIDIIIKENIEYYK